jgi:Co/Zn/Cd efflux system component
VLSGSPEFAGEGPLGLIFAVTAPSGDDLLIGTLQLPGMVPDQQRSRSVRGRIEVGEDRVTDLHLWRLGPGHVGLIVSLVSDTPQPPDVYKQRLTGIEGLSHVTVEVHACPNHPQCEAA